jgi:hypothetical protein
MKALIDINESVSHIIGWTNTEPSEPIYELYSNSARVCQVETNESIFEVAQPLFWTDCADDVEADLFYYDTANTNIYAIVDVPQPIPENQPVATGTQTA